MLSIGGLNPLDVNNENSVFSTDPIPQGLQIFDLTEMTWSSKYDANAAPYITPQVVKAWYQTKYDTLLIFNTISDEFLVVHHPYGGTTLQYKDFLRRANKSRQVVGSTSLIVPG